MFGHIVSLSDFIYYILGTLIGLFIFSFIGLVLNFIGIKYESTSGITNLFYFIMLFTSDAFYPASSANNFIGIVGNSLPLNPILHILRNEGYYWNLLPWLVIPPLLFYFIFHNLKTNR
jgi:ABC-2 type transport system permease protein